MANLEVDKLGLQRRRYISNTFQLQSNAKSFCQTSDEASSSWTNCNSNFLRIDSTNSGNYPYVCNSAASMQHPAMHLN